MDQKFTGIFPALVTPFDKESKVNYEALKELIAYNVEKGVDGFYVTGSTGEVFLLTEEERVAIMKTAREAAPEKTLIAHIGSVSTEQAIRLARHAKEFGYDAISSVAPFYYKFSFDEIRKYYFDIVEATGMKMLIYNIPAFSGVNMSMDNLGSFLKDERFIGVKHTSQDYFMMQQIKEAFPEKVIYNGYDEMFMAGLAMGADGAIGSTYNFMAEKFIRIRELFKENRIKEAQELQATANSIIRSLIKVGVMQGEKVILEALGIAAGECRAPFKPIPEDAKKQLLGEVMPLL